MERRISGIKCKSMFRNDLGDISGPVESIKRTGLLQPVVIRKDGTLVAGLRPLTAFRQMGIGTIPVTVVDVEDIMRDEVDENTVRKDFTIEEIVAIRRTFEPDLKKEAEKRIKSGKKQPGVKLTQGKSRDTIARYVGVSGGQLEKMTDIVEAAEAMPEKFEHIVEKIDSGRLSVDHAHQMVRREENRGKAPPLPEGQFDVIYSYTPRTQSLRADMECI